MENLVGYAKSDLMIPEELSVADLRRGEREGRRLVRRGERRRPLRDLRGPRRAAGRPSGSCSAPLPSLRAEIGKVVTRKVDRLSCVRFGSARYSVPTDRSVADVELRVEDGVHRRRCTGGSSPSTSSSPPGRPRSPTTTTAARGPRHAGRCGRRPPTEKAFCALGPVAEAFIKGAAARG